MPLAVSLGSAASRPACFLLDVLLLLLLLPNGLQDAVQVHADRGRGAEGDVLRRGLVRSNFECLQAPLGHPQRPGVVLLHRPQVQDVADGGEGLLQGLPDRGGQGLLAGRSMERVLQHVGDVQRVGRDGFEDLDVPVVAVRVVRMEAPPDVALPALVRVLQGLPGIPYRGGEVVPPLGPARIIRRPVLLERHAHLLELAGRRPAEPAHLPHGVVQVQRRQDQRADGKTHAHAHDGLDEVPH
ncbi:hypothetical protein P5G52_05455 [Arthrobacter sp. IIF3SC--B10]|uniref:Secreted protein n=1 Tax=Arthrobacter burdickii TaxID=3035920 RepID=A0ABT8JYY0_9MICC|nr:hypothetical protein [Arthrobacter burdickii]MDN4610309.1 hypothetical protein [Arthrobacter burdickii]